MVAWRRPYRPITSPPMLRTAFLGTQFVGQLAQRTPKDVEVVWTGASRERFRAEVPALQPDVVVIDLSEFPDGANDEVKGALEACKAELSIVTYSFARRALLRELQSPQVRVLQTPLSLETLQAHLAPLAIRRILESTRKEVSPMEPTPSSTPYKFSREQLGRLLEVTSSVQCECPNNLAGVVEKLQAFEAYSKDCESRNEADRQVHAMLYQASTRARVEMERALEKLVAHEKIQL